MDTAVARGDVSAERTAVFRPARKRDDRFGMPVGARFGLPLDDLKQAIQASDYRIEQLGKSFGEFSATWAAKDPQGFADFLNDKTALEMRYGAAKANAKSLATMAKSAATGGLGIGDVVAQIYAALKQHPGVVSRGDYDDLVERLAAAKGSPVGSAVDLAKMPQPFKTVGDKVFAATAPYDPLSMLTRAQVPKGPVGEPIEDWLRVFEWLKAHQKEVMIGAAVVGGFLVLGALAGAVKAAPIVLRTATAGVL
jgi:hypothetical protein